MRASDAAVRGCSVLAAVLLVAPDIAAAGSVSLAWDPNAEPDVAGYVVWYGTASGAYTVAVDVANTTSYTVQDLADGHRYYFAIQAYNSSGQRSAYSAEITALVAPPPRGLVAAYGFDEGKGATAADSTVHANHATLSGATWTTAGRYGGALSFDGLDDALTIADAPSLDFTTGMTIEAWVYPSALTGARSALIKERPGGLSYGLYAHGNAARPAGALSTAGVETSASAAAALALNTWTHVAVTYDGATVRMFVNGVQEGSSAASGSLDVSASPLRIGGNAIWGEYFQGRIDEVRVYDRPLSQAEIHKDMNAPVRSGLVAAYNFDAGAGSVAEDVSGNGNDGTIRGAAWVSTGKSGGALRFDGVNDLVSIPDAPELDLTNRFTLEAWVNPTALSGWRTVLLKATTGGLAYALYAHDNAPAPAVTVNVNGSDLSALGTVRIPLNTWTHLAATYDGATLRLFVNGTLVRSRALAGNVTTSAASLSIGGNLVWGEYFQGRIDDVRVYNRALSAAEVQSDMQRPVVR